MESLYPMSVMMPTDVASEYINPVTAGVRGNHHLGWDAMRQTSTPGTASSIKHLVAQEHMRRDVSSWHRHWRTYIYTYMRAHTHTHTHTRTRTHTRTYTLVITQTDTHIHTYNYANTHTHTHTHIHHPDHKMALILWSDSHTPPPRRTASSVKTMAQENTHNHKLTYILLVRIVSPPELYWWDMTQTSILRLYSTINQNGVGEISVKQPTRKFM